MNCRYRHRRVPYGERPIEMQVNSGYLCMCICRIRLLLPSRFGTNGCQRELEKSLQMSSMVMLY